MMENEKLKQLVLAKCEEVAPECGKTYHTKRGTVLKDNDRQIGDKFTGWQVWDYRASSSVGVALCDETPTDSHVWAIAAELLDIAQPVQLFDSQLHELCVTLGWQGGTYHQVLAEIKRLKAAEPKPDAITFVGFARGKTWHVNDSEELGIDCGEFGMVTLRSAVKEKGWPIHQMYCEYVKIVVEQIDEQRAKAEFLAIGGTWNDPTDNRTESHC